jgi:hypothetical protein
MSERMRNGQLAARLFTRREDSASWISTTSHPRPRVSASPRLCSALGITGRAGPRAITAAKSGQAALSAGLLLFARCGSTAGGHPERLAVGERHPEARLIAPLRPGIRADDLVTRVDRQRRRPPGSSTPGLIVCSVECNVWIAIIHSPRRLRARRHPRALCRAALESHDSSSGPHRTLVLRSE